MYFKVISRKRLMLAALALLALLALLLLPFLHARALAAFLPAAETRPLPVIMYHSLLKESDRWGPYTISPSLLEKDIIYLKTQGYTFVSMAEIIDFVTGDGDLPEKPVLLTLDDGNLNNLLYLPEILARQEVPALISVVGEYTDIFTLQEDRNPSYAYMSWTDLKEFSENPRVEIANHSYYFHHMGARQGSMRKKGEAKRDWLAALHSDTMAMQTALAERCGLSPRVYTYPYGKISSGSDDALRAMGFEATLSCAERVTILKKGDADTLFSLGRYNRPANIGTEQFFSKIFKEVSK